jgi:carboxypeptidase C (cathepsin A)
MTPDLKTVLAHGVRVLVYNGENDYIVNWVTSRDWLDAFNWPGAAAYKAAPEKDWLVGGVKAGSSKTANSHGSLTFLKVRLSFSTRYYVC